MFINLPNKVTKKDIKYIGTLNKGQGYSHILCDTLNINPRQVVKLNGYGWFSWVYIVCNTYMFIVGNCIKSKDVNPNKINFLQKIMDFEYTLQAYPKKVKSVNVPSSYLSLISNLSVLEDDLRGVNSKLIQTIIDNKKIHLQGYKSPLVKKLMYLCDNESCYGISEYGLSINLLWSKKVQILKDTSFDGYIIKLDTEGKF